MTNTESKNPAVEAAALAPQIRAAKYDIQSQSTLPDSLASAMVEANLFQLFVPKAIGGPQTDPITAFHAVEELSKVDGSVGWCSFVASAISIYSAWLPPDLARDLFGQPIEIRAAGSFRPTADAKRVNGGYQIGGRWNYVSGSDHANWLILNCNILDDSGRVLDAQGTPVTRMMIVPRSTAFIEKTWSTLGMRGTGSNDVVIKEQFVPEEHTCMLYEPAATEGPYYNPRLVTAISWSLASAMALGIARGAMNDFVRIATNSGSTTSTTLMRNRAPTQTSVGEVEAIISASRAYVLNTVETMWKGACRRDSDPGPQILQSRLAITHAIRESVRAVDMLFNAAGTNGIHDSNDLELCFRDIHTAGQHIAGLHSNFEYGGQIMMGLAHGASGW